jgi:hypothetical protein
MLDGAVAAGDLSTILPEMWNKRARGEHFEIKSLDEELAEATGFANVAAKASAHARFIGSRRLTGAYIVVRAQQSDRRGGACLRRGASLGGRRPVIKGRRTIQ